MISVLFVCTGNTCRSVMAEALARRQFGNDIVVSSAGLKPQVPQDAANTIETIRTYFNLDASRHIPRDVREVDLDSFSYIIAMDKYVAKKLKEISNREYIVWNIDDPYGEDLLEYKRCALRILHEVKRLLVGR